MITKMKLRQMTFFIFRSADRFYRLPLFYHFYQKIVSNGHFGSVLPNIRWFNRKKRNAVRFSILKIRLPKNFMNLLSKLTAEILQKVESLAGKSKQNRLKTPTSPSFSQNTAMFIEKW